MTMKKPLFDYSAIPQRLGKPLAVAIFLALGAVLQGCATSSPNRSSYADSEPEALMTVDLDRGAHSQSSPFIRFVSFRF